MSYNRTEIAEGVFFGFNNTDKFKSEYVSVNFISESDERKNTGRALASYLLMRGTEKHPDIPSLKKALDNLYSANIETKISKRGNRQIVEFSSSCLKNKFALNGEDILSGTLDILKEVIFEPHRVDGIFSEEYFLTEKEAFRDELRSVINNKAKYAVNRCFEEMDGGNEIAFSEMGSEKFLDLIDNKETYSAYGEMISESSVEIFYSGGENPEKLIEIFKTMFYGVNRKYNGTVENKKYKSHLETVKYTEEEISAKQGKLSLGFSFGSAMGESDYIPFPLFSEIYGNSPTSKLFMNVREKLSLCYYCRIVPESSAGVFVVTAGIENSDKEMAKDEILLQLDKMKNGEIDDSEFEFAKKSISNSYSEMSDSPSSIKTWYLVRVLSGDYSTPKEVLDRILNVKKEDISGFAKKIKLENVYFLKGNEKEECDDE